MLNKIFEIIIVCTISTGGQLYDSMNDRVMYIKADQKKVVYTTNGEKNGTNGEGKSYRR